MTLPEAIMRQAIIDACPDMKKRYGRRSRNGRVAQLDAMVFLLTYIHSPDMKKRIYRSYKHAKASGRLVLSNEFYEQEGLAKTRHINQRKLLFDATESLFLDLLDME